MERTGGAAITVLFATHNGEQTLPRMLAALHRLRPPRRPWRIVAADNASTDRTRALLDAAVLPMSVVDAPKPGKMAALRRALPHVGGDLVIFTDDDVEPCSDWLRAYEAAADAEPAFGLFAGPITPVPPEGAGPWFEASAAHHPELFAKSEVPAGALPSLDGVYGPNFMLRAQYLPVLETVPEHIGPRFDGRWRRRYPMGQDTRLVRLAAQRGARAYGVPQARVGHLITRGQTDLAAMLERAIRHGRGSALELIGADRLAWARRLKLLARALVAGPAPEVDPARPDPEAFERLWAAHWMRGLMLGAAF
jgi:glycosyltransferase involved in cell wall biosynthesis